MRWDEGVSWYADLSVAPVGLVVPLQYVRDDHIRAASDASDDSRIQRAIFSAQSQCERFTGRALLPQTWKLVLDRFPKSGTILLPYPPLIEVTQIQYQDADDVTQTLATTIYSVVRQTGERARRSVVDRIQDQTWPTTYRRRDAVTVTFRAGYVEVAGASPEVANVPDPLKEGIAMRAAEYYKQRTDSVMGVAVTLLPATVSSRTIWHDFKVY